MHQVHDMNDASQVGEARRRSVLMAGRLAFDEETCGRLAPGLACDLLVLESRREADLAYHYGVNLSRTVVKGGEVAVWH